MNERHEQEMMEPMPVQYSRFDAVELMCAPMRDQWPRRDWKKSQKKIRRERRQRGGRK